MDMSYASNTSGVDRYLQSLLSGLKEEKKYEVIWLNFRSDSKLFFHKEEKLEGYRKISIPLPEQKSPIISQQYWSRLYYRAVIEIVSRYISLHKTSIIHLHTLNLIDIALLLKEEYKCNIITHLHCIPWKGTLDIDKGAFQKLYYYYYLTKDYTRGLYMSNISEEHSYLSVDKIICVTKCAKDFIHNITQIPKDKIEVIQNGMEDYYNDGFVRVIRKNEGRRLLYVGALTESKGIFIILQAMERLFRKGKRFELIAAGNVEPKVRMFIEKKYSHLNVCLPGRVDFNTLKEYYEWADIGCIASLQEQSSYVAIEMAMFGLPIITTAVDGLDEMFEDGVSALKVRTLFHRYIGLHADENQLDQAIIRLSENDSLRASLSKGARNRFLSKFKLTQMIEQTCRVYNEIEP